MRGYELHLSPYESNTKRANIDSQKALEKRILCLRVCSRDLSARVVLHELSTKHFPDISWYESRLRRLTFDVIYRAIGHLYGKYKGGEHTETISKTFCEMFYRYERTIGKIRLLYPSANLKMMQQPELVVKELGKPLDEANPLLQTPKQHKSISTSPATPNEE